jgi:hypothetical protein
MNACCERLENVREIIYIEILLRTKTIMLSSTTTEYRTSNKRRTPPKIRTDRHDTYKGCHFAWLAPAIM